MMKVKWSVKNGVNLPQDLLTTNSSYNREENFEDKFNEIYNVYAMCIQNDYLYYFICEKGINSYPIAYPSILFTVENPILSKYWVFHTNNSLVLKNMEYLWAFPEWINTDNYYYNLLEDYKFEQHIFDKYKALMDVEFPDPKVELKASPLEDGWAMCPLCIDAWQPNTPDGMIVCPSCKNLMHNPFYNMNL